MITLSLALGALSVLLLAYLVRGARQLGTKLSKLESSNNKGFKSIEKMLIAQEALAKGNSQLLYLMQVQRKELDWKFEVSVTSHPARFNALALSLSALKSQILQPQSINVFIIVKQCFINNIWNRTRAANNIKYFFNASIFRFYNLFVFGHIVIGNKKFSVD